MAMAGNQEIKDCEKIASLVGIVKIADDADYERLKSLCMYHDGWKQEYCKGPTTVWTKSNDLSDFRMVKIRGTYDDVNVNTLYDVIHDPIYRKTWDPAIIEGREICRINETSDIGYYAMALPRPLTNRDFVTQRSWRDLGVQKLILNHSVNHASIPPQKSFIRGFSFMTGYVILSTVNNPTKNGCEVTYITQSDPKGNLPVWVVNKSTQWLAPKVIGRLHKACLLYNDWKKKNAPEHKPWLHPEQNMLPMLSPADILALNNNNRSPEGGDEGEENDGEITEEQLNKGIHGM